MNFSKFSNLFLALIFSFCSVFSGFCPCGPNGCTMDSMPGSDPYGIDQQAGDFRDPFADQMMPADSEFGDPMMQKMDEVPLDEPFADDSLIERPIYENVENPVAENDFGRESDEMTDRSRFAQNYVIDPNSQLDQSYGEDFGGEGDLGQ